MPKEVNLPEYNLLALNEVSGGVGDAYGIFDYMDKKYNDRSDKDNIFPVGLTDAEFRRFCIDYLLGSDWYVVDPLGQKQINECAISEILEKYSPKFRKEERKHKKERK